MPRRLVSNLLYNGDFEYAPAFTAATTTTARWIDGTSGGSASDPQYGWGTLENVSIAPVSFDTTVFHSGTKSLKIARIAGAGLSSTVWNGLTTSKAHVTQFAIPALPSTSYTLTYWMKTAYTSGTQAAADGAYATISERDGVGANIIDTPGTKVKTTTGWTQYTATVTTNANTRFIAVKLQVASTAADLIMDAWFDDIVLAKTTPDTRTAVTSRQAIQDNNASLYLDGAAGYLTLPITPSPAGFNFALWIEPGKRTPSSSTIYMSSNSAAFTDGFILNRVIGRGDIEFVGYNSTSTINTSLRTGQVSDGEWTHIAVTYLPSGVCKIYKNGVLANTVTATGTIATGTTSIYLGRRSYIATFAGLNASMLVWHNTTTPWTAAQVQALYESGSIPTGATAVYPLNEGGGSVAYDTSGNGNNGTITSGSWSLETPTKARRAIDGIPYFNGDFENIPTFVAATTSGDGCVDGTATGSTYRSPNKYGWQIFSWAGTYSAQFDTSEKYSGSASMKLTLGATGSRIKVKRYSSTVAYSLGQEKIPCKPNTEYTMKYWMKTSLSGTATSGANVTLAQYRQNGITGAGTSGAGTVIKTTTDWTQYTVTLTTNSTAYFLAPEMNLIGDDGAATLVGSAWFDDIELYPTTAITRSAVT